MTGSTQLVDDKETLYFLKVWITRNVGSTTCPSFGGWALVRHLFSPTSHLGHTKSAYVISWIQKIRLNPQHILSLP